MATFTSIVLLNLSKWDNPKKPGTGYSLDVVQSVCDNVSKGVGVEKVYYKDDGAKRFARMLDRKDFKTCAEKWPQILGLMDNPPALPEIQAAPSQSIDAGVFGG